RGQPPARVAHRWRRQHFARGPRSRSRRRPTIWREHADHARLATRRHRPESSARRRPAPVRIGRDRRVFVAGSGRSGRKRQNGRGRRRRTERAWRGQSSATEDRSQMNQAPVGAPSDFTNICRAMLLSRTNSDAVQVAEHARYDRATKILKAVVGGGSLQDPEWAGALVDYQVAVNGFVESLRSVSAFDSLLPAMVRIPMRTRAAFSVIAATGAVVDELTYKPVSRLSLAATDLV